MALLTLHKRVREVLKVAGGLPDLGVHNERRVNADHVGPLMHKAPPPLLLDIIFKLGTQWSVIPRVLQTTVNLRTGKNKTPPFSQGSYFFHPVRNISLFVFFHVHIAGG